MADCKGIIIAKRRHEVPLRQCGNKTVTGSDLCGRCEARRAQIEGLRRALIPGWQNHMLPGPDHHNMTKSENAPSTTLAEGAPTRSKQLSNTGNPDAGKLTTAEAGGKASDDHGEKGPNDSPLAKARRTQLKVLEAFRLMLHQRSG